MENQKNNILNKQAEDLFKFYDRQRVGIITKRALLSYFVIDKLITEEWLSKMLISHGFTLGQYINVYDFAQIINILSSLPEQEDFYSEEK